MSAVEGRRSSEHAGGRARHSWTCGPDRGRTEVRTVPSELFPTIAAALADAASPTAGDHDDAPVPILVVRILPGVYREEIRLTSPVVLVGADDGLPTIHATGPEGLVVSGASGSSCALRRLRLCAEGSGHALSVSDCSPLVEACELIGNGGDPIRGAPAGLAVRGASAQPIVRGCRISGHCGAGVAFTQSAGGLVSACDISRCACGIWVDGGANPLIWRNTIAGHRGAGIVVRADGSGFAMGNAILRNGAGGVLVESARRVATAVVQNRVWANIGCDLRQSPAQPGATAGERGALIFGNIVGQQGSGGSGPAPGLELAPAWPRRTVHRASELVSAIRDAPRNRVALIEIAGCIALEEPLIVDRPVVLSGGAADGSSRLDAELRGAPGAAAVVVVAPGGEASAFWQLKFRLPPSVPAGASCVDIVAGSPLLVDCELLAAAAAEGGVSFVSSGGLGRRASHHAVPTHALRASGDGVAPLLAGCALQGAVGASVLVDRGASACLLQCEISENQQGGIFLGEAAALRVEACEVSRNGHFGLVVGPGALRAYVGRTNFSANVAGSIWHCGPGGGDLGLRKPQQPLWLDECSLAIAGLVRKGGCAAPAIVVGRGARAVLWDSLPAQPVGGRQPTVHMETSARVVVAGDGAGPGMPGWGRSAAAPPPPIAGGGETVWLDISGAAPAAPPQRAAIEFPPRLSLQPPRPAAHQGAWAGDGAPRAPPPAQGAPSSAFPAAASADEADASEGARASAQTTLPIDLRRQLPDAGADGAGDAGAGAGGAAQEQADEAPSQTEHLSWLRSSMAGAGVLPGSDQNRRVLFELLSMLAAQSRCEDILDVVGLGGALKAGDAVYLRGHTGRWIGMRNAAVVCNKPDRASASVFVLETRSANVRHESKVVFKCAAAPEPPAAGHSWRLGVTPTFDVRPLQRPDGAKDADSSFFVLSMSVGPVSSGIPVYLKCVGSGRTIDIDGDVVRARGQEQGTHQRICIEKLPPESEIPAACPDTELSAQEKAWLFRRGVQLALVDKQQIAKLLSSHRPTCRELLKIYTRLWEAEWRRDWSDLLHPGAEVGDDSGSSPASRSTRDGSGVGGDGASAGGDAPAGAGAPGGAAVRRVSPARRKTKRDWIFSIVSSVSQEDKNNGNLFISALRSFFATALRMSQLEADPVQRVIEAFAEALVSDASFLQCFSSSMLPEAERKTYRTPEEVLFGLTYTTLMLNTDLHNKQVGSKMWDMKKFVGAGKDCGVSPGLMMQIFKNVQKEEL